MSDQEKGAGLVSSVARAIKTCVRNTHRSVAKPPKLPRTQGKLLHPRRGEVAKFPKNPRIWEFFENFRDPSANTCTYLILLLLLYIHCICPQLQPNMSQNNPPPPNNPDKEAEAFTNSNRISRTPTKGKLQKQPDEIKTKKLTRKVFMSFADDDDKNKKEPTKPSMPSISPNIEDKINQLFSDKTTKKKVKPVPKAPKTAEGIEAERLKKENARLVGMLENMALQIQTLTTQVQRLTEQLCNKNAGPVNKPIDKPTQQDSTMDTESPLHTTPTANTPTTTRENNSSNTQGKKRKIDETIPDNGGTETEILPSTSGYIPPTPQNKKSKPPQASIEPKQVQKPTTEDNQSKIPPIVLRNKARWTMLAREFNTRKLDFSRATSIAEGIKFFPSNIDSYRAITSFLSKNGEEYHTYQLPQDKLLQEVMRGIPTEVKLQEAKHAYGDGVQLL
ncbi:unnamed protein product [Brassicogethes aeneus]|uniref:Uncharacterized protein n=1 Tax=Brassicogethes aeneus TaxID=1431903 RepID=A0A9P0FNP6_BRAAE|nr:unnamed protein product [Brassicogethes aeneus]